MGLFGSKIVEKILDTGSSITDKVVGNSKNANQLDARNREAADGTSFLDKIIHELVILILLGVVIFSDRLGIGVDVQKDLSTYLGLAMGFLFGRGKR